MRSRSATREWTHKEASLGISRRSIPYELLLLILTLSSYACGATRVNSSTPTHTISVAPYSVNFGTQATSTLSRQTVTIANAGTKTIQITSVSLSGSSVYTLGGWTGPVNLAPSQQLSLTISFQPTAATSYSGMLTVNGTGTA